MSSSTQPSETRLRLRAILHAQFTVIVVACLLAAAVGAGLVYTTHVDPGTETQTRTVSPLTVETEYVHAAEVTEPNPVFETGTVLDGRSTYFTQIAPELDVGVETRYTAASASDVDVGVESELVIRNVGEDGEVVYWSEREPLASEQFSGVESGETVAASFVLNSTEIDATAASIEEELGASPGTTEMVVVSDVAVNGTFDGESTSYTRTIELTVDHGDGTYSVSGPGLQSSGPERTEEVTSERSYGPLRSIGGPILLLFGTAGTAALLYARNEDGLALSPEEEAYLSYRDDRSEFAEWITQIRLPDSVFERPRAEASSLRDLVDFAIDNDTGVVEDPQSGAFYAVTGELLYTYQPPSPANGASDDGVGPTSEAETDERADETGDGDGPDSHANGTEPTGDAESTE